MPVYYVDGEFVDAKQARIPVDDLAVLRGYGISDLMRTYQGQPYFLDEHIQRLADSASHIGLELPWKKQTIREIILETLAANKKEASDSPAQDQSKEMNIRTLVTAGSSPDCLHPAGNPRLIVLVSLQPEMPAHWYTKGIKIITELQERTIPKAKSTSYIPAAMALKRAKSLGATEIVYVDRHNNALEAATSNLFAFSRGILITPNQNILKGITRNLVLSLAKDIFPIEERKISLTELLSAQEVFITATNKGIVPVVKIDETIIGDGKPGNNTQKLMILLKNHAVNFKNNQSSTINEVNK